MVIWSPWWLFQALDSLPGLVKSFFRQVSPTHGADSGGGAFFDDMRIVKEVVAKYQQIDACGQGYSGASARP
jgi:hypothetical protein